MGIALSTDVQTNIQKTLNSLTQTSSASCSANCTQIQSGNTVFITGSNTGNITFDQTCTVNATCQITNSIEAAATAIQQAQQDGTAKPSFFPGIQVNTTVQTNVSDIVNNINQALDSTCNSGVSQIQTANLIYVQNSTTKDIGFNQNTDLTSQCVLSNLAKGTAQATQKTDQVAEAGGIGAIAIGAILTIIIIIIAIAAAVAISKKKKEDQAKQQQGGQQGGQKGGINVQGAARGARTGARLGPEGAVGGAILGGSGILPMGRK
jgi:hypothetical protein